MATEAEKTDRAREEAKAQLDDVIAMVARLRHCQECDNEDCDLTDEEILTGINLCYEGKPATDEERAEYHDEEQAREAITGNALSVEVRSEWHSPGDVGNWGQYRIMLCWGGPAVQITGDLDEHSQPGTAHLQYQDWFIEWTNYPTTNTQDEALLAYAREFYFAEE